ncbi:hypothetical protein [Ornithinimicrobium cryptoxanthini]|uniref:hypothetical protein n=1 Tax=Ornithinimicrobium cryptoxanthini TaxID=2934161 RepID=UPI002117F15E|nr:hypothetical protein [Ornithinimicrobium cryptoxanthini]
MPQSWQEALLPGPVPGPKQPATYLALAAKDGSVASFVSTAAPRLEWTDPEGEVEVVQEFTDKPEAQILNSDYDGRYLAYSVTWSYEVFLSPWSIYVWDTTMGGEPLLIGNSPEGDYPDGTAGVAPLPDVAVHGGQVAWVEFDPTSEDPFSRSLVVYDVETDESTVIDRGPFSPVERVGGSVVLPAMTPASDVVTWTVVPMSDSEPVVLPAEFRDSSFAHILHVSDAGMAWADNRWSLWLWRADTSESMHLVDGVAPDGQLVTWLDAVTFSDELLAFRLGTDEDQFTYVLDLRSMSYTQLPQDGPRGEFTVYPSALEVRYDAADLNSGYPGPSALATTQELPPLPKCG